MSGSKRHILLVERDQALHATLAHGLATMGLPVIAQDRAVNAVPLLPRHRLALIVFAVDPTDLSDLAAMARIRELPAGRGAPFIVLAPNLSRTRMLLTPFEVDEFLEKPLDFVALEAAVRRYADMRPVEDSTERSSPALYKGPLTPAEVRTVYLALGTQNHYQKLGVTTSDTMAEVRVAYLRHVDRYKPENLEGPSASQEIRRMLRGIYESVSEAYTVLREPGRRMRYEEQLARKLAGESRPTPRKKPAPPASKEPPKSEGPSRPTRLSARGLRPPGGAVGRQAQKRHGEARQAAGAGRTKAIGRTG